MIENMTTELKREYTDNIRYSVVAFANTGGGKVYIGINDDGSVYGVENTDATVLRVTNMVRDSIGIGAKQDGLDPILRKQRRYAAA